MENDARFKRYRRSAISEMRPYEAGENLDNVTVAPGIRPRVGDMIARNPRKHSDQWLVTGVYFRDNFDTNPLPE